MNQDPMMGEGVENFSESQARIKEELLRAHIGGDFEDPVVEGYKFKTLYDTGNNPETGTSRDDDAIVEVVEKDGTVSYAKVTYYFRAHKVNDVSFMTKDEADAFIKDQVAYFKPYWEEFDKQK